MLSLSDNTNALNVTSGNVTDIFNNSSTLSTLIPTGNNASTHDLVYKFGLAFIVLGAILLCALGFMIAVWYTKRKVHHSLNTNQDDGYTYDNQIDILQTETSDTIALEKAFGTGVLVIQESPIVRQRERLTSGTGTGPAGRISGYMSTAESDTEHMNV